MKYKVGDLVRVREDLVCGRSYGHHIFFIKEMRHLAGKTFRVTEVDWSAKCYRINCPGHFCWTDKMLEGGVSTEVQGMDKHVGIHVDKNKVIAVNLKTGKKGVAHCHPDDAFNFFVGAKLALERLEEAENPYAWLEEGVTYYYPAPVVSSLYGNATYGANDWDKRVMERGVIFQTKDEAIECAKKMLGVVKRGN